MHPALTRPINTGFLALTSALLIACGGGGSSASSASNSSTATSAGASSSAANSAANSSANASSLATSSSAASSVATSSASSTASSAASSTSSVASSAATSSTTSSAAASSSAGSSLSASLSGGFATPTAAGLPVYDVSGNVIGSTLSGARVKYAATFDEVKNFIAAARVDDAGKKVTAGAYPLMIVYSGNEDSLINQIVADHTVIPGGDGSCPKPHWDDAYREVALKDYTAGITIVGTNGSSANFGITIVNSGNVIVRNMKIGALGGANNDADMIRIDNSPNVWIDHNELFAVNNECKGSPDGDLTFESALDIKKNAVNITVSYNYIHDSKKVGLDGHTQSNGTTDFYRTITYHHNYYKNVNARLPLQRGGAIHVYNNLYDTITGSGINVRANGTALIEKNWFQNSANPITCRFDTNGCGTWDLRNNNLTSAADNALYGITWDDPGTGGINANTWQTTGAFSGTLTYSYNAVSAQCVKDNLLKVVGVGKGLASISCN